MLDSADYETEMTWDDVPPRPSIALKPRVLLVDDDRDFLEATAQVLALEGLRVSVASTPEEALASARREPPDVILLDILLGGADGLDVLEALRAEPETRSVPVIACTALGSRDSAKLLPTLGFDGLLAKPLNPTDLARALRAHVPPRTDE